MSDLEHFIDAIIQNPLDNEYRLVFADYLEEIGDARAELVRLQLEMAELSSYDKRRATLRKKELQLFRKYGSFRKVPALAKILSYHGGFVNAVEITVTRFLKVEEQLFASCPITEVTLTGGPTRLVKVAESPHLQRLAVLKLMAKEAKPEHLIPVITSPHLKRLKALALHSYHMNDEVLVALAKKTHAEGLEDLEFDGRSISDTITSIGNGQKIRKLKRLSASVSDWSPHGSGSVRVSSAIESLATSPVYAELETLQLGGRVTDSDMQRLYESPCGRTLHTLQLTRASLRNAFQDVFPNLRRLTIHGDVNSNTLANIAKHYTELEILDLSWCQVDDAGAEAIAASPLLSNLKKLHLTSNRVTIAGAQAIGDSPHRVKGQKIYLRGNPFSKRNVESLKSRFGKTFGNLGEHFYYR